jgi:peptidoglycan/xylan/chitin deacetylase (PgdA/CDA1 family)
MDQVGFDRDEASRNLWMTPDHVKQLDSEGHVIGLHSHTHPTTLGLLPPEAQKQEYEKNASWIRNLLGATPCVASHPCNSYSPETQEILHSLGVELAFRADTAHVVRRSQLEFPREDHANLLIAADAVVQEKESCDVKDA